jgi:hypothetical protein
MIDVIKTVDDLVRYVDQGGWVSLAELHNHMPALSEEPMVEWVMGVVKEGSKDERIIWAGGRPGIHLIRQALDEQRLCIAMGNKLSYFADGMALIDAAWLPVMLCPAAHGILSKGAFGGHPWLFDRKQIEDLQRKERQATRRRKGKGS